MERLTRVILSGGTFLIVFGGASTLPTAMAAAPTVATLVPTDVTASSVTGRCSVSAGGSPTSVWAAYKPAGGRWASASNTAKQTVHGSGPVEVRFPLSGLSPSSRYDMRCKARNTDANANIVGNIIAFTTMDSQSSQDVVIAAAGDICDDDPTLFAGIGCRGTGSTIIAQGPDYVVALGDLQYADFDEISNDYQTEWHQFKAITFPVIGNHEVKSSMSVAEYKNYWGAAAHAGDGYAYREDLGRWSVVVLNSNGTPSQQRLDAFDAMLDAAGTDNIIVAMHAPLFSSPCSGCHGGNTQLRPYVDKAAARGVDLLITAHDHRYEVFGPINGSGPVNDGVRQFVLGMGGAHPDGSDLPDGPAPGSEYVLGNFVGVTFFTLKDSSYSWTTRQTTSVAGTSTVVHTGTETVR